MARPKKKPEESPPPEHRDGPGRPRKPIDLKLLENMCKISCTKQEIADIFEISLETLENRIMEEFSVNFSGFYKRFQGQGKMSLRRLQWNNAKKGNVTMQIFLGKQYLGQSDKVEAVAPDGTSPIKVTFADIPKDLMDPSKQDNLDIPT
jgi:hypothetical protein